MSHINRGSGSIDEVRVFAGMKRLEVAYAKNQDNPNEYGYDFWDNIRHPETGEELRATKGYCDANDMTKCYYAEYQGKNGEKYYYLDSREYRDPTMRGTKSIFQQQAEDREELKNKISEQKRRDFFNTDTAEEEVNKIDREKFFESTTETESMTQNDDQDMGVGKENNRFLTQFK